MKNIKERVEDYVSGFHPSIQRICKESFEAGANYVLEQIENLPNKTIDVYNLIEQLKGS